MEKGGSSDSLACNDGIVARSGEVIKEGNDNVVIGGSSMPEPNEFVNVEPGNRRNPDEYLPITNVARIMRRVIPAQTSKISEEAKEMAQACVTEFICFVTHEANARCQRQRRRTVTAEDVLAAMTVLGFDDYVEPLCLYMNKYREQDPRHASRIGGHAPPRLIAPAYYVDQEMPPRVDGGERSSGAGPSALDGSSNNE